MKHDLDKHGVFIGACSELDRGAHTERFVSFRAEARAVVLAQLRLTSATEGGLVHPWLDGALMLEGFSAALTFRDRSAPPWSRTRTSCARAQVVPAGTRIELPREPASFGLPPDADLTFRLVDARGDELGEPTRGTVQEGFRVEVPVRVPIRVVAWFAAEDAKRRQGPSIRITGDLRLEYGIRARFEVLGLSNGSHSLFDLELVPSDQGVPFTQHRVEGESGPQPWVWTTISDSRGDPISGELSLGRCVEAESLDGSMGRYVPSHYR